MALVQSLESSGQFLFRYRGQIPVILFFLAVPVIYYTDYDCMSEGLVVAISIFAIVLSSFGLIVRSMAVGATPKGTSGRNTRSQVAESLNTSGIYSMVRHPLYLGNYFMWIGIVIFTYNVYFFLIVSLAFWLYYERIMFAEESFLEKKFGGEYTAWSLTVPAFIPSLSKYKKSHLPFSFKSIMRREYSGVLATVFGFTFIDLLRLYFTANIMEWNRISVFALAAALLIAILLRSLKHAGLLNEENRS
jgi:protein-S-isoprenylcysteine O-methyltransferase Ste14